MKHLSLDEKYELIRQTCLHYTGGEYVLDVGIHNYGLLHEIADALGMQGNTGGNLRSIWARVIKIMRDLIAAGYPIQESSITCCSWSSRETRHPAFFWKE